MDTELQLGRVIMIRLRLSSFLLFLSLITLSQNAIKNDTVVSSLFYHYVDTATIKADTVAYCIFRGGKILSEGGYYVNNTFYGSDFINTITSNVGLTTKYTSKPTNNYRRAYRTIITKDCIIESITMYHDASAGRFLLAVYSDTLGKPYKRLAITDTLNASLSGWHTGNLAEKVSVKSNTVVWLAWVYENSSGIRYVISSNEQRAEVSVGWETGMPELFGESTIGNYGYSIYSTVNNIVTLENNIFYSINSDPVIVTNQNQVRSNNNIYYSQYYDSLRFSISDTLYSLDKWREFDNDRRSYFMNPKFIDFKSFTPSYRLDYGSYSKFENGLSSSSDQLVRQNFEWQIGARIYEGTMSIFFNDGILLYQDTVINIKEGKIYFKNGNIIIRQ